MSMASVSHACVPCHDSKSLVGVGRGSERGRRRKRRKGKYSSEMSQAECGTFVRRILGHRKPSARHVLFVACIVAEVVMVYGGI